MSDNWLFSLAISRKMAVAKRSATTCREISFADAPFAEIDAKLRPLDFDKRSSIPAKYWGACQNVADKNVANVKKYPSSRLDSGLHS